MEGLVQDFHSALDETVDVDAQPRHPDQQLLPKGSATPARRYDCNCSCILSYLS